MRKLMLISIGFVTACVVGVYLLNGYGLLLIAACCAASMIPLFILKFRNAKIAAWILLGLALGAVWNWGYDNFYLSEARQYDGKQIQSQIEITDYCYETDYGVAADGKLTLPEKTYRVKVYLNEAVELKPGDKITGSFRLRYTADGGQKEPTYHQGNGIFLLAYAKDALQITTAGKLPVRYFAAAARQKILKHIDAIFPEDTLGFARALLLGDDNKLTYEENTAFQVSGIRHVIAVSGLHVSILFSVIYLFGGRNKVLGVVLGIPALIAFAALAGFTPSIVRACVMQGLMSLSLLVDKQYDPPTALGASALLMLLVNPLTITSVSFQLSVACMIGIFLFSQRIREYLQSLKLLSHVKGKSIRARLTRWFTGSVSVTLGAMVTTTPLCAYYFGSVSLVGVLTNLLTLWIISFIFYGIMACCVLGAIWLPLGKLLAWVVSWAIRYVLWVAKALSCLPMAAVYTYSVYIIVWLVFCYVLLAVFLLSKKKHPLLMCACMAVTLLVSAGASWLEPRINSFQFSVLDVGQGQCILLQSGGQTYMIDCGGDSPESTADIAARVLLSQGITRLDGLILTHYDSDHAAGVPYLLGRIPAETLYLPVTADEKNMAIYRENYGSSIRWIDSDTVFTDGDIRFSLYTADVGVSDNESSMCVLCQVNNCDILITGDRTAAGERKLLEDHDLPELEVLVVGHHGSKSATSMELLHETSPAIAVISVSEYNQYGHPAKETLDRLTLHGCKILRTDLMKTVVIKG